MARQKPLVNALFPLPETLLEITSIQQSMASQSMSQYMLANLKGLLQI